MTPELAAIFVLILSNLAALASINRGQAQLREATTCLQWAEGFALGSQATDPKLNTLKFDEWLARCNRVTGQHDPRRPTHVLFRVAWDISEYCGNFEDLDEEVEVPVAEVDINDEDAVYEWISGEYPCFVESVTQIKEGGE